MIFVTVGTHEQQFNRLVKYMDNWQNGHDEEVIIQTGFSTYEPKYAKWKRLFGYEEMQKNIENARVVITHGGPSSFIAPLQIGKTPIVVPRQKKYGEHVNNHQVDFCRKVDERQKNIILIEDITRLGDAITNYDELYGNQKKNINSNNEEFCLKFEKIVDQIMEC